MRIALKILQDITVIDILDIFTSPINHTGLSANY